MTTPTMLHEYSIWLGLIIVAVALIQYWAWYLVFLWSAYFFTVRLLERLTVEK